MPTVRKSGAIPPFPNMPSWCSQGSLYLYCFLLLLLFLMLRRRYPSRTGQVNTLLINSFSTHPNQLIWSLLSAEWLWGLVAHVVTESLSLYLPLRWITTMSSWNTLYQRLCFCPFAEWLRWARETRCTSVTTVSSWNTLYPGLCHCICSHCASSRNTPEVDLRVCIGSHMPNSKLRKATVSRNAMQSTHIAKANAFFLLVTASPIILLKDCVKYCVFYL